MLTIELVNILLQLLRYFVIDYPQLFLDQGASYPDRPALNEVENSDELKGKVLVGLPFVAPFLRAVTPHVTYPPFSRRAGRWRAKSYPRTSAASSVQMT